MTPGQQALADALFKMITGNLVPGYAELPYNGATALTANHYLQDTTSAVGDYLTMESDGAHWIAKMGTGYSGTWADSAGA
jgi:hypothetical protein